MARPFIHSLRGALTWRYMVVTVSALLVIELLLVWVVPRFIPPYAVAMEPDIYLMERLAATAAGYLATDDYTGLTHWLDALHEPVLNISTAGDLPRASVAYFPQRTTQTLLVFRQGTGVLALTPSNGMFRTLQTIEDLPGPLGSELFRSIPPHPGANGVRTYSGSQSVAVSPIQREDGTLLGLLILVNLAADTPPSASDVATFVGVSLLVITIAVGILGAFFGSIAARFLAVRVEGMERTTAAWGVGNFTQPVSDGAGRDELDDLAGHLNQLRTQIQSLLAERERWAAQAERDHVARELHDSVKQYLFTIRMHLATAQTLAQQGQQEAMHYVQNAAVMTQHAQAELGAIIQVLHQSGSEGDVALPTRLRTLISQWSNQTGIVATLEAPDSVQLPVATAHALTRVVQEALANIYKHSGAQQAQVKLHYEGQTIRLIVTDNGRGFDLVQVPLGLGLISMRERIEALGGQFSLTSSQEGTTVSVTLPEFRQES